MSVHEAPAAGVESGPPKSAQHTPGPWVAKRGERHHSRNWVVTADHAGMRADTPLAVLADFDDAAGPDARLIAAAPDLLAALKAMVLNDTHTYRDCHKAAVAVIAKASGIPLADDKGRGTAWATQKTNSSTTLAFKRLSVIAPPLDLASRSLALRALSSEEASQDIS